LVVDVSPLCTHCLGVITMTGWFEIRIMCPSGATTCCFGELA
jgi:hypothetical protein